MLRPGSLIPRSFFLRPAEWVAPELLGQVLHHGGVALRITEVEAYGGPEDSASHCRFGRTPRNAPMWEAGGLAYLYLCYGLHWMLNVVTGPRDQGAAVLIRAAEPISGLELIRVRRGGMRGPALLNGPGKVGQALGLEGSFNGKPLFRQGGLELRHGIRSEPVLQGPRVGIEFAEEADRLRPWRFALGGSAWVSRPKPLASYALNAPRSLERLNSSHPDRPPATSLEPVEAAGVEDRKALPHSD